MKQYIFSFLCLGLSAYQLVGQPLDRSKRPEPGPAPEIKIAKADTFRLENGLRVFVVENHKLPKVSFQLVLDYDPVKEGDKTGVADITGELIKTGTTTKTKEQIDKEIDLMGADFFTSSNGFFASSLKKHSDKLMSIVSDVILNTKLNKDEFDKIRTQTASSLASQKESPNAISAIVTNAVLYGKNHPYGENVTDSTLSRITLADCENFYKAYYRPNVGYLAIVGDITKDEAMKLIKEKLGAWPKGDVPTATYPVVNPAPSTHLALVNRDGSVQSVINITNPISLQPGSADDIPAKVMNNILGGGASGRLFQNLREKHGYTYGAYSRISSDELVGNFTASASVRNNVTDSSVVEFMTELYKIRNAEVSDEEIKRTLSFMTGNFARSLEDPKQIANQAINIARYNLPQDYYNNYLKTLNAVNKADVKRVAEKFVLPQNVHIVIVGNATELKGTLAKFGALTEYDVEGNPIVKKEPVKVVEAADINAEQLTEKYTNAIGGSAKIKALKDYQIVMNMDIQGQPVTTTFSYKAPNLTRKVVQFGPNIITTKIFDGAKGIERTMQGTTEFTGKELEDMRVRSAFFPETQYKALGIQTKVINIEEVMGKKVYVMEADLPSGEKVTYYFEKETGLKLRENFRAPSPLGGFATVTVTYDDYKEVGGVKFAHKMSQRIVDPVKGPQTLDFTVKEIKTNVGFKKKFFTLDGK